jgi:hypothetical protein
MTNQNDSRKPRQLYEAPRLARIVLRAEEAVLGHCKSTAVAGTGHSHCNTIPVCSATGS